ncbi:retrovirus-related pol polyprotein from transposon 17.6 [Tanacetum coccineum]
MEVFMDDFSVFGNSFENCLSHVDKMLQRCEDTNLCLNWEKSHFMVKEGIVLGHKISKKGIEVDKAKVDVIAKLPYPTTVKGVRSFLGHAGAVLGQRHEKHFRPIHYASKTMNEAESHYTTTEKEMLAMVTFSNPLFDDSASSNDESSHEEVTHEMSFITYSLFDLDEEIISSEFNPIRNEVFDSIPKNDHFDAKSYLPKSPLNHNTLTVFSPRNDPLHHEFVGEIITNPSRIAREHEKYISRMWLLYGNSSSRLPKNFHASPNTIIESFPIFPIPVQDNDENSTVDEPVLLHIPFPNEEDCFDPGGDNDEIGAFLAIEVPTYIEEGYYDSDGDVLYLERLLIDDTTHNLFSEVLFDHEPQCFKDESEFDTLKNMVKTFDPGIYEKTFSPSCVRLSSKDHHYLFFTIVVQILFTHHVNFLFSFGNEDTIFDPDIST